MPEFSLKRSIGVELQFDSTRIDCEQLAEKLQGINPTVHEEAHTPVPRNNASWVVKPNGETVKVCSPTMPADVGEVSSMDILGECLSLLNFRGFSREFSSPITRRCSYHLRIDARDIAPKEMLEVMEMAWKVEPAIKKIIPPSRRNNDSCRMLRRHFEERPETLISYITEGHLGIDILDYLNRGSIEIRYAAGTSNVNKILFWIVLWTSLVERTLIQGPPENDINSVAGLIDWLRWPEDNSDTGRARAFFLHREEEFAQRRRERVREMLREDNEEESEE